MVWVCSNCKTRNLDEYDFCYSCDLLKEDSEYGWEGYNSHSFDEE